jgi:hypothetical protein
MMWCFAGHERVTREIRVLTNYAPPAGNLLRLNTEPLYSLRRGKLR